MSRYIDADALKYYGNHIGDEYEDYFHETQWVYRSQIDNAPSIDIVRCKECKHWRNTDAEKIPTASIACGNMHPDDFCSYGQKERASDGNIS